MSRFYLKFCCLVCLWVCGSAQAGLEVSLPFQVIEQGSLSGAQQDKPVLFVIQDQAAWEDFWSKHQTITPKTKPKPMDFNHNQILAIVDSDQPNSGYRLRLERIEQHDGELWVYVTREQPAPKCLNLGRVAQPFVIATTPQFAGEAKLIFNTKNYDCVN